jgi:DNA-binding transcriptional regulator GbsR (MarR family)
MATRDPDIINPGPDMLEAQNQYIEVWGRMGSVWGISRTMAEVHALLYITGQPLCTDDVMDRLEISRGNASMSLRALVDWGIISRVRIRGERREFFTAEQDVWTLFRAIARERLKREVDPLLAVLHDLRDTTRRADASAGSETEDAQGREELAKRLEDMLGFIEMVQRLGQRFSAPSGPGLRAAATMLSRLPLD